MGPPSWSAQVWTGARAESLAPLEKSSSAKYGGCTQMRSRNCARRACGVEGTSGVRSTYVRSTDPSIDDTDVRRLKLEMTMPARFWSAISSMLRPESSSMVVTTNPSSSSTTRISTAISESRPYSLRLRDASRSPGAIPNTRPTATNRRPTTCAWRCDSSRPPSAAASSDDAVRFTQSLSRTLLRSVHVVPGCARTHFPQSMSVMPSTS
mmetsp:Transcript_12504/g.30366  ORF Transcript_12504/g.30366 Transcript_12504/m.30366 type:complete len:209 (-) Transcript_12504:6241-6867(-)